MIVLMLQIFVSLMLVAGSVVLFVHAVRSRTFDHADRLALAPLEDDGPQPSAPRGAEPTEEGETRPCVE